MLPILETERLILRAFDPEDPNDVEDAFHYASNPHVAEPAGFQPPADLESERQFLRELTERGIIFALQLKETGRVIGSVGIHKDSKHGTSYSESIGYSLAEEYWGRGLAAEAVRKAIPYVFDTLPIDVLRVYHYHDNGRSRRVIEKCGFVYEGTLRRIDKMADGTFKDDACHSILREEYESGAWEKRL